MSYQFNNQVLNAILADLGGTTTYPYDIDALNAIIVQLGGTGGHYYLIDAYNELCGIQSVTAGHKYLIDALNAINVAGGGTSEQFELPALVQLGAVLNYPFSNEIIILLNLLTDTTNTVLGDMSNTEIAAEADIINGAII